MALPKILTCYKGQVVVDEVVLAIPELKELYEVKGINYLQYLYCKYDPESPYLNFTEEERDDQIIKDIPEELDMNNLTFVFAANKCEKLYDSPYRRILKGAKIAMDNLSTYLATVEVSGGREGNFTAIVNAIEKLPKVLAGYAAAENAYKMEVQKNRAGMKSAVDEDFNEDYNT